MDPKELLLIAGRASVIYFFLLFIIRISGKRSVGQNTAFDLLVALMLGEIVDEAIYGDISMSKSLMAISVIALWHAINSYLSYKSRAVEKLTTAPATVMVQDGKILSESLADERISKDELLSELRLMSIDEDDMKEVKRATLEPNGQLSVIQEEWAKPIQKSDLPKKSKGEPK